MLCLSKDTLSLIQVLNRKVLEHHSLQEMYCIEISPNSWEFKIHYQLINRIRCRDCFPHRMHFKLTQFKRESMLEEVESFRKTQHVDKVLKICYRLETSS